VTPAVHKRLVKMTEIGCSLRALIAEANIRQREVARKYDAKPGDVSFVVTRNVWPPRGSQSQVIARAFCWELGLPIRSVFPDAPRHP
jgi:hypothetical protein